ncbi:MAG: OmpH family outer membrane protein [Rikenellaceae bacterium]
MKQTLILAAIASLILTVSCGDNSTSTSSTTPSAAVQPASGAATSANIAFIRMDSVMNSYGLFMDLNDEFNKKQAAAQKQLQTKVAGLEREVAEYQEKVQKGLVTRYQATSIEEGLQKKQQEISQYQEKTAAELSEAQMVMSSQVSKEILDYLNEYNAVKGYSMILQTMGGSPVIIADPALDITSEVLMVLNARYEESLAKSKK